MDSISDLLTRIRNAAAVKKSVVSVSYSKMNETILGIFKREGFLDSIEVTDEDSRKLISIKISDKKAPSHIAQISKPGRRIYVKSKEMPKPLRGLGIVVVSTSTGIVTGREAAKKGLGGEVICEIW